MLNHSTGLFCETISRPLGGAGPSNFYTPYNSLKCISSRTWGAGRPHVGLCPIFLVYLFFNQTQDLRAPSADRRETLHSDQHMRQLFNARPKIRGSSPKKIGRPKTCKIWTDFTQLSTLIANISGTRQDIKNRKDM